MKTLTVTETRGVDNETALTEGVAAGAAMTLLGQSQPETQRPAPHSRQVRTMLETQRRERAKESWIEELGSSQNGCTRKKG